MLCNARSHFLAIVQQERLQHSPLDQSRVNRFASLLPFSVSSNARRDERKKRDVRGSLAAAAVVFFVVVRKIVDVDLERGFAFLSAFALRRIAPSVVGRRRKSATTTNAPFTFY